MKKVLVYTIIALMFSGTGFAQLNNTDSDLYSKDLDKLAESIFISFELLEEGRNLYNAGEIEKAQIKFQKALQEDPENEKAKEYLQLCSGEKGKTSSEASTKSEKKSDMSKTIDLLSQRIKEAKRQKASVNATSRDEYEDLSIDRKIKKAKVFVTRGDTYFSENKYEEAYHLYKKAVELLQSIS